MRNPSRNEKGCLRNCIQLSNRSDFVNQGTSLKAAARIKKPGVNVRMRSSSEESVKISANPTLTATLTGSSQSKRRTNFFVSKEASFPITQALQSFNYSRPDIYEKNLEIRIGGNKGVMCLLNRSIRMATASRQCMIAIQQLLIDRIPRMLHHQGPGILPQPPT